MSGNVGKLAAFDVENGNWSNYCDRLEMFFLVNETKEDLKVPTLISVVGDAAYDLMLNLCSPKKPKDCSFSEVAKLMSEHIQPKPSFLAERYKFRQCRQEGEQNIAAFVAELKKLSRFCEFSTPLDDNMRDQFVCGIKSDVIRQRLFAEEKVTWQKAVTLASTLEAAERDSHIVEKRESVAVNAITRDLRSVGSAGGSASAGTGGRARGIRHEALRCWACGQDGHWQSECRYKSFVCSKCQEIGHLRRVCLMLLSRVVSYIRDGWPDAVEIDGLKPYFNRRDELYTELGIVMWGHRVIIPTSCRDKVLKELHDTHMGVVKTKSLARSYVWWPGVDEAIQAQCRACAVCAAQADAPPGHVPRSWPWPARPWTRLHLDFLGPLEGLTYLIIIDAGTKWIEAIRMRGTTAHAVICVLRNLWARFGIPRQVVSDNGPPFISAEFKEFLERNGVEQVLSAPYHPASNGAAENAVKICKNVIKKALKLRVNTDTALDRYLLTYRNTEHSTTGVSPAQALQGRSLRTRLDCLKPDREARVRTAQLRQQDSAGGSERQVNIGDPVWFRQYRPTQPDRWVPGQVAKRLGDTDYNILADNGTEVHRHIDQLRSRLSLTTPGTQREGLRSSLIYPGNEDGGGEESSSQSVGHPGSPGLARAPPALASPARPPPAPPLFPVRCSPERPAPDVNVSEARPARVRRPPNRYGFEFD